MSQGVDPEVIRVAPSTVRRSLVELVGKAREGAVVVIEADRIPVATLVPVNSFEEAVRFREELER